MASTAGSSSFPNVYYKRAVATAKACYVCNKPTTVVLATVQTTDFLYTCAMHLEDRGFATKITDDGPAASPSVSAEEIARVREEYEARQKRKAEEKEKKAAEEKEKEKDKEKEASKKDTKASSKPSTPAPATPPTPATPKHEKYALHRDMFLMRQSEHRRRRNAAQAKDVAPRIPAAPRSTLD